LCHRRSIRRTVRTHFHGDESISKTIGYFVPIAGLRVPGGQSISERLPSLGARFIDLELINCPKRDMKRAQGIQGTRVFWIHTGQATIGKAGGK
jgi:hypothetical protein